MKGPRTIYTITRCHGLRTHLLTPTEIGSLIKAKDLAAMIDILMRTDYAVELSELPREEIDEKVLERIVYTKLSKRIYHLLRISSGGLYETLAEYVRKVEIENLKRIFRALHGKEEISQVNLIPIPREFLVINFPALIRSKSVQEAVELLRETDYADILNYVQYYEEYESLLPIEVALDKIFSRRLRYATKRVPDGREVRDLLGMEIDARVLSDLLTLKTLDIPPETFRILLGDAGYKVTSDVIEEIAKTPLDRLPGIISTKIRYDIAKEIALLLEARDFGAIERTLLKWLYTRADAVVKSKSMSVVYVFAYILLCEREARNLVGVINLKRYHLEPEKIQAFLL